MVRVKVRRKDGEILTEEDKQYLILHFYGGEPEEERVITFKVDKNEFRKEVIKKANKMKKNK